jgi:hypothetical protein
VTPIIETDSYTIKIDPTWTPTPYEETVKRTETATPITVVETYTETVHPND